MALVVPKVTDFHGMGGNCVVQGFHGWLDQTVQESPAVCLLALIEPHGCVFTVSIAHEGLLHLLVILWPQNKGSILHHLLNAPVTPLSVPEN